MYSLSQFMTETQGTLVASRGGITGQCVSLVQKWSEVNGVSGTPVFPVANARDMNASTRQDAFTWIPNKVGDPNSKPIAGDVVVFSWNHTGVCISSDGYTMQLWQQNDPTGSTAHQKAYNFNGCTGWLRLKNTNQGGTVKPTITQMRYIHADSEGWNWKECMAGKYDAQFNDSWGWRTLDEMLADKWSTKNDGWRQNRQDALDYYATKGASEAQIATLKKQLADVTKQYQDLLDKPVTSSVITEDQAVAVVQEKVNPLINFIKKVLGIK